MTTAAAGALMATEIAEQPAVLAGLLAQGGDAIADAARRIAKRRPRFVLIAARGTSDHAALYAQYLVDYDGVRRASVALRSALHRGEPVRRITRPP